MSINQRKNNLIDYLKRITLPGFDGIPLWNIGLFFFKGIINGAITTRASAIAFSFFIALFPMMLFFFSLIAYVPIDGFQDELLGLLKEIMPQNAFLAAQDTIEGIIENQRFGLLSIGFVSMLFFATNGINSLMSAFGATYQSYKGRNWLNQYFVAMLLVCIISVFIITAVALMIFSRSGMEYLVEANIFNKGITYYLLLGGQLLIIAILFFSAIAIIYYFAPYQRGNFRLFSAGASFATILMIITSWGFSYYIDNFGQYNKIYGSIGTLIVILIWLYVNALTLLIGFELNLSIYNIMHMTDEEKKDFILPYSCRTSRSHQQQKG